MEGLPHLALALVCQYLAHAEPHRTSLLAFASVSRTCRAAARRELFSNMSIDVDDAHSHQKLKKLERMLEETKRHACVRVLKLGISTAYQVTGENEGHEDAHIFCTRSVLGFHPIRPIQEWKPRTEPRPDTWWLPFAQLISSLHLRDLIWASTEQVPVCILSVLGSKFPGCRLHVHGFDLRSLHQRDTLQDIDDAEYMLATSPCLYCIVAPYSMYDASGCANYNGEAILRLTTGLAPNLKHVRLWDNSLLSSGEIRSQRRNRRLEWRGFYPQSGNKEYEPSRTESRLQSLAFHAIRSGPILQLSSWEHNTNFSGLRSLQLVRHNDLGVLQDLVSIAARDGLSGLEALDLPAISCEYEDRAQVELMMTRLFLSLRPLIELSIVGASVTTLETILERHGAKLQLFYVKKLTLSLPQVIQLRKACPKLSKLSIEILRSAGDCIEIETYRIVGSMGHLESLSLVLQCTDQCHGDGPDDPVLLMQPSNDEEEREAISIAIKKVFINAAVDECLAQSIFRQIFAAHASVKAGLPPRLSSIRLDIGGATVLNGQVMDSDFSGILAWIGRSWTCRRDPRDAHQNNYTTQEVNSETRLCKGKEIEDEMEELSGSEQYADIWKSLWPDTGVGWKKEWRSVSLASDNEPKPYSGEKERSTATEHE